VLSVFLAVQAMIGLELQALASNRQDVTARLDARWQSPMSYGHCKCIVLYCTALCWCFNPHPILQLCLLVRCQKLLACRMLAWP